MKRQIAFLACALGLAASAFFATAEVTLGQAAAEYRARAADAKAWPREAVRGAKAMVATGEELGSRAGGEILKGGGEPGDGAVAAGFLLVGCGAAGGGHVGR